MASTAKIPRWIETPPSAFDIVTCYYPARNPKPGERPKLRPALVLNVYRGKTNGGFACQVAYGTSHLKTTARQHLDLIIQNAADLSMLGLPMATRFDLDLKVTLPWIAEFFGVWRGYTSPRISALNHDYIKEYAYCMMVRKGEA
jgi:hypothetical protein